MNQNKFAVSTGSATQGLFFGERKRLLPEHLERHVASFLSRCQDATLSGQRCKFAFQYRKGQEQPDDCTAFCSDLCDVWLPGLISRRPTVIELSDAANDFTQAQSVTKRRRVSQSVEFPVTHVRFHWRNLRAPCCRFLYMVDWNMTLTLMTGASKAIVELLYWSPSERTHVASSHIDIPVSESAAFVCQYLRELQFDTLSLTVEYDGWLSFAPQSLRFPEFPSGVFSAQQKLELGDERSVC